MSERVAYQFESLADDLPRPPLAALRALLQAGLLISPKGWEAIPVEARYQLARAGLQGVVDTNAVRALAERVPPRFIKLVPRVSDPDPDHVPEKVARALGSSRPLSDTDWRTMRAVDRAVLASLAPNARLIALAYEEIAVSLGKPQQGSADHWFGFVARCEIKLSSAAIDELTSPRFLEGRALLLARVAGIRAARRVTELLDLHADASTGHVELDWTVSPRRDGILWQAHVSSWEGAFFPAASLLAATTAASAVLDMIRHIDPAASVKASLREEDWLVGSASSRLEEATTVYTTSALMGEKPLSDALAAKATVRMDPADLPRPPIEDLIASSLAAPVADVSAPVAPVVTTAPAEPFADPPQRSSQPSSAGSAKLSSPSPSSSRLVAQPGPGATVNVLQPSSRTGAPMPRTALAIFIGAAVVFLVSVAIFAYVFLQR